MSTTLQLSQSANALASFSPEQMDVLRNVLVKGASNDELSLFIAFVQKKGLDPFTRQVFGIMRPQKDDNGNWYNKMTIQISIDGFRVIAQRTGKYRGQLGPFWCGDDGVWRDVWLSGKAPSAAKVGVLHSSFDEPVWAVALYKSYVQTNKQGNPTSLWAKMPEQMLAKCAESLALRKAFPDDMSGMYSDAELPIEEVQVNDMVSHTVISKPSKPLASQPVVSKPSQSAPKKSTRAQLPPKDERTTEEKLQAGRAAFHATGTKTFGKNWDKVRPIIVAVERKGITSSNDLDIYELASAIKKMQIPEDQWDEVYWQSVHSVLDGETIESIIPEVATVDYF